SVTESFQVTVTNLNDTPVVVTPVADASTAEDAVFSYDVSASFADDDSVHGDTLTYSATQSSGSPLPAWLTVDPATGVLSGTPANADVAGLTLTVVATDSAGAGASASFQLTVTNTNDAPVVVTPIADASPLENALFNYDVTASFADDDALHGDTLTYSAEQSGGTPLPSWLSIDPATGILSGTPDATQIGIPYTIAVTATDDSGATVTSTFNLSVDNVNDAPVLNVAPSPTLTAVAANAADPAGDTIADIIVDGSITDADGGAVEAMALTGADDSHGTWEFSINAGSSWTAVRPVSDNAALLLDGTAMLRFVPDPGFGGSATFTFRAWDQTTGSNGQTGVDVSANGGTTAFSLLGDTGSIVVQGTAPDLSSGSEFQINTTTADEQRDPSIAALNDGGFVVTWQSKNQDGDIDGIYGQRYDSTGSTVGSEFQINTTTVDDQDQPSVTALGDGGFVVTWQSKNQDGDNWGIYGQRYDSGGSATGTEFQINTTTADEQKEPSVATLADGGFVVSWQSKNQDGDNWGVYGQRYDNTSSAVGSEFQINTTTSKQQEAPSVAALEDGGFVVTWHSKDQDGDNWGIYGQRYDNTGSAVGSEFHINTTTADEQKEPSVAALDDGGFVVTWQSKNQDGDNWGIYGQRYDSAGNAVEFEFQINQETSNEQKEPAVSALADGGFFVTWQSRDQDGDNWGVYGRRFNADGDPLGSEFQINTTSVAQQEKADVAALSDGGLAMAWQSRDQDGDNWGVFGHRYDSETATVTVNPPQNQAASTLDFGGSNSYVDVDVGDPGASSDDLDPGRGDFTVEAWFYYDGPNGRQSIVSKGNDNDLDAGFNIFLDDDTLVVRASTDGGLDGAAMKVTMTGAPGWHHVAMVLDQESGSAASTIKGYLDGSDAAWTTGHGIIFSSTVTTSASRQIQTGESFLIGAVDDNSTAEDFFDGEIADVRVWNTARSQVEIQADLGRTLNGDEPHLLANWRLDDGVGPTASDATGAYNGALTGSPAWQDALNLTTAQDTALAGRLSASDLEGDDLAYSVAASAANGTASIDADKGTWTYDPNAGFSGSDSFSYQISDGNGGSDTVTIAVTVTP
ncbi:MAG: putative Ig domain-containing protein, partial [Geminicoccaceae bacterium]